MTMRTLIAGVLGGIAMFIWATIAHTILPLGEIGISQMQDDGPAIQAMQAATGDKAGLYIFPAWGSEEPDMAEYDATLATSPSGVLIYHPAGRNGLFVQNLAVEFVNEVILTILVAYLLAMAAVTGFVARMSFVAVVGVLAALASNASYWNWYGFPLDYTLATMFVEFVGYLAAGAAIAWWFGRSEAKS